MNNTNNIFFRVNDTIYNDLNKIKNNYKFRSIPELVNTIVKVFCDLYANKKDKEETIEDSVKILLSDILEYDNVVKEDKTLEKI